MSPRHVCVECEGAKQLPDHYGRLEDCYACEGHGTILCDVCPERLQRSICTYDGTAMCLACLGLAVGEAKRDYDAARDAWRAALRAPTSMPSTQRAAYQFMQLREAQRDALVALASHVLAPNDGPEPPPRAPAPAKPNGRFERGAQLAADPRVRHVGGSRWLVPSQSGKGSYNVDVRDVTCTCVDFQRHGQRCKHLIAAETVARRAPANEARS